MTMESPFFILFVMTELILGIFCLSGKLNQLYQAKSVNTSLLTPLAELRNVKYTRCALSCYMHTLCQSFDYSPSESRCLLHNKTLSTAAAENVHHNTTMTHYENYVALKYGETCNTENKCNAPQGKCFLRPNSFFCACETGYSGQFCETPRNDECYLRRPSQADISGFLIYDGVRNIPDFSTHGQVFIAEEEPTNYSLLTHSSTCKSLCQNDSTCNSSEVIEYKQNTNPVIYEYFCYQYESAMPRTNNTRVAWDMTSYFKDYNGVMKPFPYGEVRPTHIKEDYSYCSIEECTAECKNTTGCIAAMLISETCWLYDDVVIGKLSPVPAWKGIDAKTVVIDSYSDRIEDPTGIPLSCSPGACT